MQHVDAWLEDEDEECSVVPPDWKEPPRSNCQGSSGAPKERNSAPPAFPSSSVVANRLDRVADCLPTELPGFRKFLGQRASVHSFRSPWGFPGQRVELPPMDLDEWLQAPSVEAAEEQPTSASSRAGAALLNSFEEAAGQKIGQLGVTIDGQLEATAQLVAKGNEIARSSVAGMACKLLPKVEALKEEPDSQAEEHQKVHTIKDYVMSVLLSMSTEAIYLACRGAGVDPVALQEETARAAKVAETIKAVSTDKYISYQTIRDALLSGDTILVKGSWLIKRCSNGGLMPARQELEARFPSAIWKVDELLELAEAGAVGIISVSYCWCTQVHPDPKSEQMQILCRVLKCLFESTPFEDAALFIDWCSLYQRPRSFEQDASYERAMDDVHIWYLHQGIRAWMLTRTCDGAELSTPYYQRGWPSFEMAVCEMVTQSNFLLDLGLLDDTCSSWDRIVATCRLRRKPPVLPEAFEDLLRHKSFTDGQLDCTLVAQKYAQAFLEAIAAAEELAFNDLGWGDNEVREFSKILAQCCRLRKLVLYGNQIGEEGANVLLDALLDVEVVEELWLNGNPLSRNRATKQKLLAVWVKGGRSEDALHF